MTKTFEIAIRKSCGGCFCVPTHLFNINFSFEIDDMPREFECCPEPDTGWLVDGSSFMTVEAFR